MREDIENREISLINIIGSTVRDMIADTEYGLLACFDMERNIIQIPAVPISLK